MTSRERLETTARCVVVRRHLGRQLAEARDVLDKHRDLAITLARHKRLVAMLKLQTTEQFLRRLREHTRKRAVEFR